MAYLKGEGDERRLPNGMPQAKNVQAYTLERFIFKKNKSSFLIKDQKKGEVLAFEILFPKNRSSVGHNFLRIRIRDTNIELT